ncbi:hypothetical protein CRUP_001626, partial [Coryphaenoides rupestris]
QTYSEGYWFPSVPPLLLLPVGQHPLQQLLGQLLLPGVLRLHQRDGLCQTCPVATDQPPVQFIQKPLLWVAQVLHVLPERCCCCCCGVRASTSEADVLGNDDDTTPPVTAGQRPPGGKSAVEAEHPGARSSVPETP